MILYTLHPGAERDPDETCRWYKEKAGGRLIARHLDEFDHMARVAAEIATYDGEVCRGRA